MSEAPSATALVADYVRAARIEDVPAAVQREGRRSFINILGCTIGGARHTAVETTWKGLAPFAGAGHCTLVGRAERTDAVTAALINTLSSSINTYDDTHAEAIVHPSGPVMAAVLAVAERQPVSGADLLLAFTLGVEIVCRLSKAISVAPAKSNIGWSQTGITCGVGAALAAAKLMRLDAVQTRRAISIAISQAAGIRNMHGTMCTAFMPAQAGQTGLRAAYLAQAGLTSSENGIEGRYGFTACFAEIADLAALTTGLGQRFEILSNTYKPYPCGIVINPMIHAALSLRAEHKIAADAIEHIALGASPGALALCDRRHPKDEFEGQVSFYHWIAAAFVRGRCGVPEGTDAAIHDPTLTAFRERITAKIDPAMPVDGVDMTVTLKDGRVLAANIRDCIGSRGRPMTDDELDAKLSSLSEGILPAERTKQVLSACHGLAALADAKSLIRLTTPQ